PSIVVAKVWPLRRATTRRAGRVHTAARRVNVNRWSTPTLLTFAPASRSLSPSVTPPNAGRGYGCAGESLKVRPGSLRTHAGSLFVLDMRWPRALRRGDSQRVRVIAP